MPIGDSVTGGIQVLHDSAYSGVTHFTPMQIALAGGPHAPQQLIVSVLREIAGGIAKTWTMDNWTRNDFMSLNAGRIELAANSDAGAGDDVSGGFTDNPGFTMVSKTPASAAGCLIGVTVDFGSLPSAGKTYKIKRFSASGDDLALLDERTFVPASGFTGRQYVSFSSPVLVNAGDYIGFCFEDAEARMIEDATRGRWISEGDCHSQTYSAESIHSCDFRGCNGISA
ncbi:MAG: hypothetical protein GY862_03350 [Gammaproteobacteria bacterium]|nr:hypothetical protein [Gammaproteobacteria bacterium]